MLLCSLCCNALLKNQKCMNVTLVIASMPNNNLCTCAPYIVRPHSWQAFEYLFFTMNSSNPNNSFKSSQCSQLFYFDYEKRKILSFQNPLQATNIN